MLHNGEPYRGLGGDYFTRPTPDRLAKRPIHQLEALGHHVTLTPKPGSTKAPDNRHERRESKSPTSKI
jgi:hypothetical protein